MIWIVGLAVLLLALMTISFSVMALILLREAWLDHRDRRQSRRDAQRLAKFAERRAAENGRPHSSALIGRATTRRPEEHE